MKSLKYTKLKPVILALGTFSSLYSAEFMSETGKPGQQFNDKNRCIKVLHDSGEPVLRRRHSAICSGLTSMRQCGPEKPTLIRKFAPTRSIRRSSNGKRERRSFWNGCPAILRRKSG